MQDHLVLVIGHVGADEPVGRIICADARNLEVVVEIVQRIAKACGDSKSAGLVKRHIAQKTEAQSQGKFVLPDIFRPLLQDIVGKPKVKLVFAVKRIQGREIGRVFL